MLPNPAADIVDDVSLVDELEDGEELAAPLAQDTVVQDERSHLKTKDVWQCAILGTDCSPCRTYRRNGGGSGEFLNIWSAFYTRTDYAMFGPLVRFSRSDEQMSYAEWTVDQAS